MHLLYCDESNIEERDGDFLIYGGLAIDSARARDLSTVIDQLRRDAGVDRSFRLKFNPGPEALSHEQFIALKRAVIRASIDHGAILIVYLILHDVAVDADTARRNGINTVCFNFDRLLTHFGGPGLVLIDRFNDTGNLIESHLRDKFSVGLTWQSTGEEKRLDNIVGFHYSAVGQSHFPSIIDIALGSLRFAINAHTRGSNEQLPTAHAILKLLEPLFWRSSPGAAISEWSCVFSPKSIRAGQYRVQYQGLKEFLAASGVVTEQSIGQRGIAMSAAGPCEPLSG